MASRSVCRGLVAALLLLLAAGAARAGDYYLQIEGIRGESKAPGHGGWIDIEKAEFEPDLTPPRDRATGQSLGRRTHRPFVVIHNIDAASPVLFKAAESKRKFGSVRLEAARGTDVFVFRNVIIAQIRKEKQAEQLTLTYEEVERVGGTAQPQKAPAAVPARR